jgi:hypothetical protein
MSAAIVEGHLLTTDNVLSEVFPFPLPQVESGLQLYFDIPTFHLQLSVLVTEVDSEIEAGRITFKATIDDAIVILTTTGNLSDDGFKIEHVNIHMERVEENARADFIISTIRAALVLADNVHLTIPDIFVDLTLSFSEPLLDIGQMLRRRQIDYRIMVIERTVGREFHLPIDISGDEVRDITLAYHAIIEHSFVWPINSITVFFPATKEWSDTLVRLRQETSIPIGPDPFSLDLFGHKIELGHRGIIIKDAVIEDFEIVQRELSKDDGHLVPIVIHSTSGQARYDFFGTPEPPTVMWNSNIKIMVELEPQLDTALVNRYHTLAASTLIGLTEEEKGEVTTRPELGEAFLINNPDGE